jgi:insertion element IS1 protein InsB
VPALSASLGGKMSRTFLQNYSYQGCQPKIKRSIIEMALNGSGIRDTARVLNISPSTVIEKSKNKESQLHSVNLHVLETISNP